MTQVLRLFIFLLCLLLAPQGRAISMPYTPQIVNYSVADYKAGNQNWAVAQAPNGWMYFGNNRGLLQFDGVHWKLYPMPSNVAARSLYITQAGRIYTGSFEEFGYFEPDNKNQLTYHSLKEKVTGYTFQNDDIWTINEHDGKIYFQSFASFFVYDGEQVTVGRADLSPLFFFSLNGELYAQFINGGFCRNQGKGFTELIPREKLNNDNVVGVLPYRNQLLLVTAGSGFYLYDGTQATPWDIPASNLLKTAVANRATFTQDSLYIIGTISNGLLAVDANGQLKWHINLKNGLINNTVLGLRMDARNNLWAVLDNGLANIQTHSPIYIYEPKESGIGMVYNILIKKDEMYLATNQGIYIYTEKEQTPQLIPNTNEQTWFIVDEDNQLIAGHNRGTLLITDKKAERLAGPNGGGTALAKCIIHGKEILLQTSYYAVSIYIKNEKGQWTFSHNLSGFNHPVKSFEVDAAGTIWANHMYKGVYRFTLDETLRKATGVEHIEQLDKTNGQSVVNVMKLRGRIVLTDGIQFYTYEDLQQRIIPYTLLNESLPNMGDTYRIVSLNNDRFWFIHNAEYVLVNHEGGNFFPIARIPFSYFPNPMIEDRGNMYIDKDGFSYFFLNGGIARFNPALTEEQPDIQFSLASVQSHRRDKNEFEYLPCQAESAVKLDYLHNNMVFELALPDYSKRPFHIFYKLNGYDTKWIEAPTDYILRYSNIPTGEYQLEAVVKDEAGDEVSALTYSFEVQPHFLLSLPAFIIYILLLGGLLVFGIKTYTAKEVNKKNRLIEKQRLKQAELLKEQEQLIVRLKNEKLEYELNYKSKELASATLSIISQNDFLISLKKDIQSQQLTGTSPKKYFEKLVRLIDENVTKADEWDVFQANFDRVHEQFFQKLKGRYHDLTPGDLRMCALLRLNMPTKDMAKMLSLSIRGVEAARYRLRKKLNLPEGDSLVDFMITFH